MKDLLELESADTSVLHLKSPIDDEPLVVEVDGQKRPSTITLYGPGSEPFIAAERRRTNRALARSRKKIDLTADMVRSDGIDFLVDVTASIDNLPYSAAGDATGPDLARAIYTNRKLGWIVDQANTHLSDYANFSTSSPQS